MYISDGRREPETGAVKTKLKIIKKSLIKGDAPAWLRIINYGRRTWNGVDLMGVDRLMGDTNVCCASFRVRWYDWHKHHVSVNTYIIITKQTKTKRGPQ